MQETNYNIKVKIFHNDNKLKLLGELISNPTSRKIMKLLSKESLYVNVISKRLGIEVSIVIYHLKKMQELNLLNIEYKPRSTVRTYKHYSLNNSNFFIKLDMMKNESNYLKKTFSDKIKVE